MDKILGVIFTDKNDAIISIEGRNVPRAASYSVDVDEETLTIYSSGMPTHRDGFRGSVLPRLFTAKNVVLASYHLGVPVDSAFIFHKKP